MSLSPLFYTPRLMPEPLPPGAILIPREQSFTRHQQQWVVAPTSDPRIPPMPDFEFETELAKFEEASNGCR